MVRMSTNAPGAPPDPRPAETSELFGAVRDKLPGAFDELYRRVAPALFAWADLRIPPAMRGSFEPEDVVQETWLRAVRGLDTYAPERSPFRSWIFGVARHVLLEGFRQAALNASARSSPSASSSRAFALDQVPAHVTTLSTRLARDEQVSLLREVAEGLDELDRKILGQIGFEGATCAEVADRVGSNEELIKKRWQRLRARLGAKPELRRLIELDGPSPA
jgi:RNA polymerase sigma factor (sigma-70 family)